MRIESDQLQTTLGNTHNYFQDHLATELISRARRSDRTIDVIALN